MQFIDHIFVFLLVVGQPLHGWFEYRRYVKLIEAGSAPDRNTFYRSTLIVEWLTLAVLIVTWLYFSRPFSDLGIVRPGGSRFWIGAALLFLVCAYLIYAWRSAIAMSDADKSPYRAKLGYLSHFLPATKRELHTFFGVSVTAGVVEEAIYRGFMLWYFGQMMPLWVAVIVSSVVFGLGHSYLGASGCIRTGIAGLAFGVFYVFTGSIWLPIVGHALFDALQGVTLREILRDNSVEKRQKQK